MMPSRTKLVADLRGVDMVFEGLGVLNATSIPIWQNVTGKFIGDYLGRISVLKGVDLVDVALVRQSNYKQRGLLSLAAAAAEECLDCDIRCNMMIEYRSEVLDYNMHGAVEDAFRTGNSKFVYNGRLMEALPSVFGDVEVQSVTVPFAADTPSPAAVLDDDDVDDTSEDGESTAVVSMGLIIGCAAGAFVVLSAVGGYYRYNRARSGEDMKTMDSPLSARDALRAGKLAQRYNNAQEDGDGDSVQDIMVARYDILLLVAMLQFVVSVSNFFHFLVC